MKTPILSGAAAATAIACISFWNTAPVRAEEPAASGGARPRPAPAENECGIKPPVDVAIDANWGAGAGGRLPITAKATLLTDVPKLRLHVVGRGAFDGVKVKYDFSGNWASGAKPKFSYTANGKANGEGSLEVTWEALDADGKTLFTRRSDIFALFEKGKVWGSYSSPTDLRLWRAKALKQAGQIGEEQLEAETDSAVGATVPKDNEPHDLTVMSATEWRLQRAFEASAPPAPAAAAAAPTSPAAVPLTVAGKVQWTDSAGKKHGLPMARVEIRDEDLTGSDLITTVTTDAGGNYTSSFSYDDGLLQGNPDIFVRVLARSPVADIKPDTASGKTYFMDSPTRDEVASGSTLTINLTAGNSADNQTVFEVHHALVMIGTYAGGLAGTMPSQVDVRFPTTRSTSLFDSSVKQLHILRLDRHDWDVVHHEYGHYFQNIHGFQQNPGGRHSFNTNLSSTRGSKSVGVRLAWGEGWPTFFGTSGQDVSAAKALNIPNVGDVAYQDTEDASTNLNIETSTGVGEDDEVSVISSLWDLYDSAGDGADESTFSDKMLFNTFKGAVVKTMGDAWEAVAAPLGTSQKASVGGLLGQAKIAPELLTPADNLSPGATPPAFTWRKNGGGTPNPLNDFRIRFYTGDFSSVIFEKDLGDVATFTPTAAQWTTILGGSDIIKWIVEGKNTTAPATSGGTLGRYWSRARTLGGISIAFVIDDTGSMGEEIAAVRNALQSYITTVQAGLSGGKKAPTIQLVTFKDSPSIRITSNDLTAVSAAVGSLFASGGGDCPEGGAQAIEIAVSNISPGGTILFATDASSQPGVDIGAVIARARGKGVTVNTILSGDCSGISSSLAAAPALAAGDCGCEGDLAGKVAAVAAAGNELQPAGDQSPGGEIPLPPVVYKSYAGQPATGFIQKPGASDPPQTAIIDPGQPPLDEAGGDPSTAAELLVGDGLVRGVVGLPDDSQDYFAVHLNAGTQYAVRFRLEAGNSATFELLNTDGTSVLRSQSSFSTNPGQFAFMPSATGDFFIRVSASDATFYLLGVSEDPFSLLTSAIEMFSTISGQTGGAFIVRDDVNSGNTTAYEAAMLNIMLSTLKPTVLVANPDDLRQGTSVEVELIGSRTNWRKGSTVRFEDSAIKVTGVDVVTATRLRVSVTVGGGTALGFQNVKVETPLGDKTETATGLDLVEIVAASTTPAVLSVEQSTVAQGDSTKVTVRGINTSWDGTSVLTLGNGITVDKVSVKSPTLITATISVSPSASIGFRSASVSGPGANNVVKTRALFVNSGISAIPEIVRVTPSLGNRDSKLDVVLTGINTHFINGVTTATFGDGVRVLSAKATGDTTVNVRLAIDADADLGFRNITLDTGGEIAVLLNGFFVDDKSGGGGSGGVSLPKDGELIGSLDSDERKTYSFKAGAGDKIVVTAPDKKGDGGTRRITPRIRIIDADGADVIVETLEDKHGKISVRLPADGKFRLIISDARDKAGKYELHVKITKRKLPPWLEF